MKKSFFILFLLTGTMIACQEDETLDLANDNAIEFQGKNAVIRSSNLSNVRLKNIPASVSMDDSTPEGEIRVEGSEDLDKWVEVREEGGELRIKGKEGFPSTVDLNFYMNPKDIAKIVVEGDNKVLITSTPVLDYLELVTEGASELVIHNLKVNHLVSKREGKSRMFLSSELTEFGRDSIFFPASAVQVLDERHIVYTEEDLDFMLYASEIKVRNDSVFALGYVEDDGLRSYYITETHELRNEGESFLDALELPSLVVRSRNEGKSESKVWAKNQLTVKGEGESVMYYKGNPEVDQKLEGSSELIKVD